jgi:type IV secretory pathway VirB2 component (pilin)
MNSRSPTKLCLRHGQLAAHVDSPGDDQFSISELFGNHFDRKLTYCRSERTNESMRTRYKLLFGFIVAATLLLPTPSRAAADELPWDQTLLALQNILIGPVAHAAIGLAFVVAGFLYAVGGYDKQAARLAASGISGCLALGAIRLLNFVFP